MGYSNTFVKARIPKNLADWFLLGMVFENARTRADAKHRPIPKPYPVFSELLPEGMTE